MIFGFQKLFWNILDLEETSLWDPILTKKLKGASFCFFSSFSNKILHTKTVGVCRMRTRIVRIDGEHADHLTTTQH